MNDYKYLVDLEDVSTGYNDLRIEEVKIKILVLELMNQVYIYYLKEKIINILRIVSN